MKKLLVIGLGLLFALGASSCWAGTYFSGNVGTVWLEDSDINYSGYTDELSFDPGYGLTAALGGDFGNGARGEIELGYRSNDFDEYSVDGYKSDVGGDFSTLSLMGNAYFDFPVYGVIVPFIGGGVGVANINADWDDYGDDDDTVFAYQFMAGAGFAVSPTVKLDVQYRYFATSDPEFTDEGGHYDAEYSSHNVMLGFRTEF